MEAPTNAGFEGQRPDDALEIPGQGLETIVSVRRPLAISMAPRIEIDDVVTVSY